MILNVGVTVNQRVQCSFYRVTGTVTKPYRVSNQAQKTYVCFVCRVDLNTNSLTETSPKYKTTDRNCPFKS